MIKKYRKKPVVIEAIQYKDDSKETLDAMREFVTARKLTIDIVDTAWKAGQGPPCRMITIETLEGDHRVTLGDFIIKGIAGEFYPCKPDIFHATYEEVKE